MSGEPGAPVDPNVPPGWRPMNLKGLVERIGPVLSQRAGDGWRYGLVMGEAHVNALGIVHGGTLMTLLDHTGAMSAVWYTKARSIITVSLNTRFLGVARVGDLVVGEARLTRDTASLIFLDAQLTTGDRLIADAAIIMKRTGGTS